MADSFKLSRRIARLRAPVFAALILAFSGCESAEPFNPDGSVPPDGVVQGMAAAPEVASISFAGGIPIGFFNQPISQYGSRFNGSHQNSAPSVLLEELRAIKARGGKVVLALSGSPKYYLSDGHFSLTKWKERVNRFKGVNFYSFIQDGTVIGHYMIDEPNDASNWGGRPVTPSTLEEMAKYSKQIWPNLPTIVRVDPGYLDGNHRYLDAAWAQYLSRRGDVGDYIDDVTSAAKNRGLALVVGLNVLKGGRPNGTPMTASEVESWGSALLSSSYPCAFINWKYTSDYMSSSSIKNAMDVLRHKAENRSNKSCRGS
jgi:hypothetical protein